MAYCLCCGGTLMAQTPDIEWAKCYGGSGWEHGWSVLQMPDSGYVVFGDTPSNDGDVTGNHGSNDFWLVRINTTGGILWQKTYGGSSGELARYIALTSDGGFIACGSSYSNDLDVSGHHGPVGVQPDYWVVKLDASGNIQWQHSFGGTGYDAASYVMQTSDGGFLLSGISLSNDGDVSVHHGELTENDAWVIKLDSTGDLLWQKTFGGDNDDFLGGIIELDSHAYLLAGSTSSIEGDVTGNHGLSDSWICKITADGSLIWSKCYGGSNYDNAYGLEKTNANQFALAVLSTESSDGDVTGYHGVLYNDVWTIHIDSTGTMLWQKCYGGTGADVGYSTCGIQDSTMLIAGFTTSLNGDVTEHFGQADAWLIDTDSSGNLIWQKSFGGSLGDYFYTTQQTLDGGIICGGYTNSVNHDVSGNHGSYDYWVVKLSAPCIHTPFYADMDADGFGNPDQDTLACNMPAGFVTDSTDCNDANNLIFPTATDICNALDDNCNGSIDEDAVFTLWFVDADADGYGNPDIDSLTCFTLTGFVNDSTDCNDANNLIYPTATDICNALDDNCNGIIDEDAVFTIWFADVDADGFGDPDLDSLSCFTPSGFVSDFTDCNDANNLIYPTASDICNALDDNCNGIIDEDAVFTLWFVDADADGYGNPDIDSLACFTLSGFVTDSSDCNDADAFVFPDAAEVCNNTDDNCNGFTDEGLSLQHLFMDADGDGFGNSQSDTITCLTGLVGYVSDSTDCDDTNALIFPGAAEVLNGVDDNCNKLIDEGLSITDAELSDIVIYPNPTDGILYIAYTTQQPLEFVLQNITGQIIITKQLLPVNNQINLAFLPAGAYLLIIYTPDIQISLPVLKE